MRSLFKLLLSAFRNLNNYVHETTIKSTQPIGDRVEKPVILGIFDTFTHSCFEHEFQIIAPNPENWNSILENNPVEALFYESAWHGNGDTWLYQIGRYNNQNNKKLKDLVAAVKSKSLPVIFWNKEDPVHFEHFMVAAQLSDYVFTTDSECIPGYKERLGHEKVFALPFAAQPKIHNPIGSGNRVGSVCFAGTYHTERYKERQSDIDILLKPALGNGLEIYDRNFNPDGHPNPKYKFPDIYLNSIKGKLDYEEMVKAYKNFKVFLNVNSVRNSPTMFSRRVFELLASGTPVISSYSKGIIDILGEDTVLISENEQDTKKHLEKLLFDENYWWNISLNGLRKVHESHTYYHRVQEVFSRVGSRQITKKPVSFLIVSIINYLEDAQFLSEIIENQTFIQYDILLSCNNPILCSEVHHLLRTKIPQGHKVEIVEPEGLNNAQKVWNTFDNSHIAIIQSNNFYGKNYLRDYALAISYSGAGKIGKKSYFTRTGKDSIGLINRGTEYTYTEDVSAGSLVMEKALTGFESVLNILSQDTYKNLEEEILSIDPYNYIKDGKNVQKFLQDKAEI